MTLATTGCREAATMTITLSLVEQLLVRACRCQELGRTADALAQLTHLASLTDLAPDIAEEVQARLGELHLKRRRFRTARRHLLAALAFDPDNPRYHRLLGWAEANDPRGDLGRALRHYRRALTVLPEKARWRAEAGLIAVRLGRTAEGLALLQKAHAEAAEDSVILGKLVKGLCLAGQIEEAEQLVRLARFRTPRCPVVARLWIDLRVAGVRRQQDTAAAEARAGEPVLLPFVRPVGDDVENRGRYDGAHALPGPHLVRLRVRRVSRRAP
jgi:Flp pilus assembly protein TadD